MFTDIKPYSTRLSVPLGDLKKVLEWCEISIGNRYKFMEDPHDSTFWDSWVFIFDREEDLLMFVLCWK